MLSPFVGSGAGIMFLVVLLRAGVRVRFKILHLVRGTCGFLDHRGFGENGGVAYRAGEVAAEVHGGLGKLGEQEGGLGAKSASAAWGTAADLRMDWRIGLGVGLDAN